MSGTGSQRAPHRRNSSLPKGRSPLAHLLHALNQPLTGLQCSLELATAGPRRTEQYIRTLRDALDLTGRMRILVEAIRDLSDGQPMEPEEIEICLLDDLLRDTADGLLPVAATRNILLSVVGNAPLPVRACRARLEGLIFRILDSALSLTLEGTELRVGAEAKHGEVWVVVSWNQGPSPDHSPFSRPELGLLIAQAGWEQLGAEWITTRVENMQTCTIRLPLASFRQTHDPDFGDLK